MRRILVTALLLGTGCKTNKGPSAPSITVSIPAIPYGPNANAPPDAVAECKFEKTLPDALGDWVKVAESSGNVLTMTVVRMGGGIVEWEGEHTVIVEGEYVKEGEVVGTFRIKRGALGGAFGGMSGVCRGFDEVAYIMAEDISDFLANPSKNAKL